MSYTSIVLRFIRNQNDAGHTDDVLTITPSYSDRMYDLTFEDRVNGIVNKFSSIESEILDYVDNLFVLLGADDDPYNAVQVDSPSFPSVIITMRKLERDDIRDSVMDILRSTLRNYPSKVSKTHRLRHAPPLTA